MTNGSSTPKHESEALIEALYNNSCDRILSYQVLKEKGLILTSLECAHLGLEIAMKLLINSTGQQHVWGHDLTKIATSFLNNEQYKDLEGLMEVAEALSAFINGPSAEQRFWSTQYRYSLAEPTTEMTRYADSAVELAQQILEAID